jgi:hypothetical protein
VEETADRSSPPAAPWHVRKKAKIPFWQRLSPRVLAQTTVTAASGTVVVVRIRRNSPVDLSAPDGISSSDLASALVELVAAQAKTRGRTGWTIQVVRPATLWRAERSLFIQRVNAAPLVVDIALAVVDAIQRGEKLWDD